LIEARRQGVQWAMNWPSEPNQQDSNQCVAFQTATEQAACQQPSGQCGCSKPAINECSCSACQRCAPKTALSAGQYPKGVLLVEVLKCRGAGDNWQGLVISLPPPVAVQIHFPSERIEGVIPSSACFTSISFPPAVPPPRLLVAVNCLS
jgi:hypothetical protein